MKLTKIVVGLALVAGTLASGAVLADRGHSRINFGINLGVPIGHWYYPPYYYPPYYPSYPPVVISAPPAPVYVEKGLDAPASSSAPSNYWYYCTNPQGYFPYVQECTTNWMKVVPQAPDSSTPR